MDKKSKKAPEIAKNSKPPKTIPKTPERFQMPVSVLNQLDEFSKGFVLLAQNGDGVPMIYSNIEKDMVSMLGWIEVLRMHADALEHGLYGPRNDNRDEYDDSDGMDE